MPSVFTIQGPPLDTVERLERRRQGHETQDTKKQMDVLCDLRRELFARADKVRQGPRYRAYRTAGDVIQRLVEDYPGGRDYFWSKRCGTKQR